VNETQISLAVREALLASGRVILWRNNTGKLQDRTGRWVTYGLGVGGADLVGILKGSGRFVAFEVKVPGGRISPEQEAWHRVVNASGGYARVVHSVDEAMAALRAIT
jgi:hypothetical protein